MQRERLSALIDGEVVDSELLSVLCKDSMLQQRWNSYHLIRDTLRGDITQSVIECNIAARVAVALERESICLSPSALLESQPKSRQWSKMPFWKKAAPWTTQLLQAGMAACVSLTVIFGVQYYNRPDHSSQVPDSPVFNTLPIMGQVSPVSLGIPASETPFDNQQVQKQRQRINEMLQDYELQRRLHSEQLQLEPSSIRQAAVPDTQSLGIQQQ